MKGCEVEQCLRDFPFPLLDFLEPDEVINISDSNDDWVVGCTYGEDDCIFGIIHDYYY